MDRSGDNSIGLEGTGTERICKQSSGVEREATACIGQHRIAMDCRGMDLTALHGRYSIARGVNGSEWIAGQRNARVSTCGGSSDGRAHGGITMLVAGSTPAPRFCQ